jgi:hypothetical protein
MIGSSKRLISTPPRGTCWGSEGTKSQGMNSIIKLAGKYFEPIFK